LRLAASKLLYFKTRLLQANTSREEKFHLSAKRTSLRALPLQTSWPWTLATNGPEPPRPHLISIAGAGGVWKVNPRQNRSAT